MLFRRIRFWLWGLPFRATILRVWDQLPLVGLRTAPLGAAIYRGGTNPLRVVEEEGSFHDDKRDIAIGYHLFRPAELSGKHPVVVFSRGLYFSDKFPAALSAYLGRHFAAHGYLVLHIRHIDSDRRAMPEASEDRDALGRQVLAVKDNWNLAHDRFLDLSFVLDELEAWNEGDGPLSGSIDLTRIGMSGYSFGARTALVSLGEVVGSEERSYKDRRIKAGISYGPSPLWRPWVPESVFAGIEVPALHISGSREYGWFELNLPEDRTLAYRKTRARRQYLMVLKGADHHVFSGERAAGTERPADGRHHELVRSVGLAFWDAYLKDDEAARRWLDEDFPRLSGRDGKFARK